MVTAEGHGIKTGGTRTEDRLIDSDPLPLSSVGSTRTRPYRYEARSLRNSQSTRFLALNQSQDPNKAKSPAHYYLGAARDDHKRGKEEAEGSEKRLIIEGETEKR